jgi:hypothetical protein
MKYITCCIHQFMRPKRNFYISIEGVGDCRICTPDKENKKCKRYFPITVVTFEVGEG